MNSSEELLYDRDRDAFGDNVPEEGQNTAEENLCGRSVVVDVYDVIADGDNIDNGGGGGGSSSGDEGRRSPC